MQGARCMDCGIPFCNNGCPVNNNIPDFNDAVYKGNWREALEILHSTNNFPEMTGRICPAPCEAACTLGINAEPVGIKSLEHAIIDKAGENGWVRAATGRRSKTGKKVAVVGSGPAGLAAAQQLARVGHDVTVFEKNDKIGGLLRYGIPDFKLDKRLIDWRVAQMRGRGRQVPDQDAWSATDMPKGVANDAAKVVAPSQADEGLRRRGAGRRLRDAARPAGSRPRSGRRAFRARIPDSAEQAEVGGGSKNPINAAGKHVVVIGGGDTGSDCVGTSNRHGAASVTQFELLPKPPEQENKPLIWPYWPTKLRTSSSHDEGCARDWSIATKEFIGENGKLKALKACASNGRTAR